jgi:uncharacterized protein
MEPVPVQLRPRLAALLWPSRGLGPAPGIVIVHGAGSRKENHADFAEACARAGLTALALDLRGHGESAGAPDAGMLDDVVVALEHLRAEGAAPLGLRGSSLGGFLALHAAARHPDARAVVALCPPSSERIARLLGAEWPLALPLEPAVARTDGVARGYWHARGDERVPGPARCAWPR